MNIATHGMGVPLSLLGGALLLLRATEVGSAWQIASTSVYAATLIFLYTASTLYHIFSVPRLSFQAPSLQKVFGALDQTAIFLLIAGTYTPFTLVLLRGAWGWSLFGTIWGIALLGILARLFFPRASLLPPLLYVAMGWLILVATKPMLQLFPHPAILLLLWGGIFFTAGLLFFPLKKIPYRHALWHLFVLAGSSLHYLAIYYFVLPLPPPLGR